LRLQLRGPLLNGLQRSKRLILVGSSKRKQRDQFATLGRLSAAGSHTAAVTPLIMQSSTVIARTDETGLQQAPEERQPRARKLPIRLRKSAFQPASTLATKNFMTGRTLANHLMTTAVSCRHGTCVDHDRKSMPARIVVFIRR